MPKNLEMEEVPQNELENDSIRVWINPQRSSVYSIKGTIGEVLLCGHTYEWSQ